MKALEAIGKFTASMFNAAASLDTSITNIAATLNHTTKAGARLAEDLDASAASRCRVNTLERAIDEAEAEHKLYQRLAKLEQETALDPELLAKARAAVAARATK